MVCCASKLILRNPPWGEREITVTSYYQLNAGPDGKALFRARNVSSEGVLKSRLISEYMYLVPRSLRYENVLGLMGRTQSADTRHV
jgi:hypothetical protein